MVITVKYTLDSDAKTLYRYIKYASVGVFSCCNVVLRTKYALADEDDVKVCSAV